MSPAERVALRQENAKPIFDALKIWLKKQLGKISGKTPLAKAIRYALARMPKVRPYLDNGFLELDNNTVERAIRSLTLRQKNSLFMGSEAGSKSAAIAYSLIETAKMNNSIPTHGWHGCPNESKTIPSIISTNACHEKLPAIQKPA